MNAYIVAYDVDTKIEKPKTHSQVYSDMKGVIETYDVSGQLTESCWCICSTESAKSIRDKLCKVSRECDRVLVVQSAHVAAWSNLLSSTAWLQSYL